MEQPKRRLSAVWFADLVGYTALSTRDEPAALRLVDTLQTLAREIIPSFEGRIVKFIGDAVLAEFGSTDSAVRAAVTLQERFTAAPSSAAVDAKLRIGVHLGEVNATPDGDLYGDGINTAARLQRESAPGQVIVSEDVWRQLRQRPEFRFSALGAVELRGITAKVEIYDVLFGARAALAAPKPPAGSSPAPTRTAMVWVAAGVVTLGIASMLAVPRLTRSDAPDAAATPEPAASLPAPVPAPSATPPPAGPRPAESPAKKDVTPPESSAAKSPPSSRARPHVGLRPFIERLIPAMMSEDPARLAALGPGTKSLSRVGLAQMRQTFGDDLTIRLGRMDLVATRDDAVDVRFFLLARGSKREETPLAFDATISRTETGLEFTTVQRAWGARGRRGGQR